MIEEKRCLGLVLQNDWCTMSKKISFFLNPDTEVHESAIDVLVAYMKNILNVAHAVEVVEH